MKTLFLCILLVNSCLGVDYMFRTEYLYDQCKIAVATIKQDPVIKLEGNDHICFAYIRGMMDQYDYNIHFIAHSKKSKNDICNFFPLNIPMAKAYIKYYENHPDERIILPIAMLYRAMREAFPCHNNKN